MKTTTFFSNPIRLWSCFKGLTVSTLPDIVGSWGGAIRTFGLVLLGLSLVSLNSFSQVAIRYQNDIKGGVTIIGNSWFTGTSGGVLANIDNDASTTASGSADLILPAGSTILKAYLAIEKNGSGYFTSTKLMVPGASSYTTLPSSSTIANRTNSGYQQAIWDITSLMPANGYVSIAGGGAAGRYFLADPLPAPSTMGGWSIIVVYSNPNSKFRNVTVADNWQYFS